jgi:hypothetical protein
MIGCVCVQKKQLFVRETRFGENKGDSEWKKKNHIYASLHNKNADDANDVHECDSSAMLPRTLEQQQH